MNPVIKYDPNGTPPLPRTRGDEPLLPFAPVVVFLLYPAHAGMNPIGNVLRRHYGFLYPAHAGMNPRLCSERQTMPLYPAHAGMNHRVTRC